MTYSIRSEATRAVVSLDGVDRVAFNEDGSMELLTPVASPSGNQVPTAGQLVGANLVSGTPQTASGTAVDFTSVPAWVKRITVMFRDISSNGTADIVLRLGTSGGVVATGYRGAIGRAGNVSANFADGFALMTVAVAASSYQGHCVLTRLGPSSNIWVASLCIGDAGAAESYSGGGSVDIGGVLTTIQLTTTGGANTFDAGTVNIMWE